MWLSPNDRLLLGVGLHRIKLVLDEVPYVVEVGMTGYFFVLDTIR